MLAMGALDGLRFKLQLSVPNDVQVIGFDDIPQAAHLAYNLTTLRQNSNALATSAVAAIVARRKNFQQRSVHGSIAVSLVSRGSTIE
jgi:Transcriptional regulators